ATEWGCGAWVGIVRLAGWLSKVRTAGGEVRAGAAGRPQNPAVIAGWLTPSAPTPAARPSRLTVDARVLTGQLLAAGLGRGGPGQILGSGRLRHCCGCHMPPARRPWRIGPETVGLASQ